VKDAASGFGYTDRKGVPATPFVVMVTVVDAP
jgi:hypothetical protein